jgi:hypothetical protein
MFPLPIAGNSNHLPASNHRTQGQERGLWQPPPTLPRPHRGRGGSNRGGGSLRPPPPPPSAADIATTWRQQPKPAPIIPRLTDPPVPRAAQPTSPTKQAHHHKPNCVRVDDFAGTEAELRGLFQGLEIKSLRSNSKKAFYVELVDVNTAQNALKRLSDLPDRSFNLVLLPDPLSVNNKHGNSSNPAKKKPPAGAAAAAAATTNTNKKKRSPPTPPSPPSITAADIVARQQRVEERKARPAQNAAATSMSSANAFGALLEDTSSEDDHD